MDTCHMSEVNPLMAGAFRDAVPQAPPYYEKQNRFQLMVCASAAAHSYSSSASKCSPITYSHLLGLHFECDKS
ncbi:hypothetical protein EVAR_6558_1 [Eumeta japonica]|uniref:Uncharacterized protein n=1 Tax=Eumeta variegata TaxID=151549 RepID=A0A4C1SQE8_EUMVA|nr:hypothetical protein EVAR_6558_1 [Eumeta japonica]